MATYQLGSDTPDVPDSAYIADEATLIGKVMLGEHTSVWPGAVVRADNEPIRVGNTTNIQDGAVLHADPGIPLTIGNGVSVGHQAMLHGCTIGDGSLVGIQAVILNKAVIGKECLVGAGAVVTEGKTFPDRSLIVGAPAKVLRMLSEEDVAFIRANAEDYSKRAQRYKAELKRIK